MKHPLNTTSNGLSFTLDTEPKYFPEGGPTIIVHEPGFTISAYCLATLEKAAKEGRGVCVTSGKYEKYCAIEADDLRTLIDEAKQLLSLQPA